MLHVERPTVLDVAERDRDIIDASPQVHWRRSALDCCCTPKNLGERPKMGKPSKVVKKGCRKHLGPREQRLEQVVGMPQEGHSGLDIFREMQRQLEISTGTRRLLQYLAVFLEKLRGFW